MIKLIIKNSTVRSLKIIKENMTSNDNKEVSQEFIEHIQTMSADFGKTLKENKELVRKNQELKLENEDLETKNKKLNTELIILAILLLGAIIYIGIKIHSPEIDYDPNVL